MSLMNYIIKSLGDNNRITFTCKRQFLCQFLVSFTCPCSW